MWKYINSNELYHAWPKGYKKGPDGTPLGYVSKDSQYNDKKRGTFGEISGSINTFKPVSIKYKVNTSDYKVNTSNKKEKSPYKVVPINKNKEEPEIEKFNPINENTTKKGKEKVVNMFKNEKVDFDFNAAILNDKELDEIIKGFEKEQASKEKAEKKQLAKEQEAKEKAEKEAKEKAEKERLAKEKAEKEAKEKAEKERLAKEKAEKEAKEKAEEERLAKEKAEKEKRDLGLEMQSIKNKQEQQKLDAATADEKRKAKDFEDRKAREAYLDELNRYSNASNNFGTAGSRLGSAGDTVSKIRVQEKEKLDLSQFSSEELKRRIERNRLEQEYNDRFAPETRVSKGKRIVTNILYGTSALSNLAGSVASIIGAIKSFKNLSNYKK